MITACILKTADITNIVIVSQSNENNGAMQLKIMHQWVCK